MAIDTENKRRSTLQIQGVIKILPVPDGSIDDPDRTHVWQYSGITIGVVTGRIMSSLARFGGLAGPGGIAGSGGGLAG